MSFNTFGAKIKVVGVGGGGGNAVNTMIRSGLEGVDFIVANTDAQALQASLAPHKIQLGKELTKGLGAGADPDIGRDAALEDRIELQEFLSDADMVFITAGMGGGTGTGAAAVVAQIARELGALTVAVVTKPFAFEGKRRRKHAEQGVARLRECVDTLITIPNQRLLQVATPDLSMLDAFKLADNVLVNAVRGISDIINTPGLINVDFADVKTVMSSMGHALMGIGYGTGAERALSAARQAISSPLLEDVDIEGATGILINITAGTNVSIMEVNNACMVIQEAAHDDANIIFGAVIDETLGDEIRITVIATGFPVEETPTVEDMTPAFAARSSHASVTKAGAAHMAQRLVAPPRLTTPLAQASKDRATTPVTAPVTSAVTASASAPSPIIQTSAPSANPVMPAREPQVMQSRFAITPESFAHNTSGAPKDVASAVSSGLKHQEWPSIQAPVTNEMSQHPSAWPVGNSHANPFIPTRTQAQVEGQSRVDASQEAAALAQWTLDDFGGPSDSSSELESLEIAMSDAPGTRVFEEAFEIRSGAFSAEHTTDSVQPLDEVYEEIEAATPPNSIAHVTPAEAASPSPSAPTKTVAELVFASEVNFSADVRAGAIADSTEFSWDFDAPNPDLVSDEIDRRIDEALALAGQMTNFDSTGGAQVANIGSELDLDDLDLPAFLRSGPDSRQI
jgi:cell division protein FtsZ